MDFVCSRREFAKGLHLAETLTNRAAAIPAFSGILLETKDNTVCIRATDLAAGFEMSVPAREIRREGGVVIPARPSIQLISSVGGDTVRVESDDAAIHITTHATTSTVKSYPKDDFPTMPKIAGQAITFSVADLLGCVRSVFFAVSRSDIRPEIASVLIRGFADGRVKVVSTDSFRLAEKTFSGGVSSPFSFLFPWRRVSEFTKILENFSGSVECVFDRQHLFVRHGAFSYFTRLTEGVFPDYEQVIPQSFTTEATVSRADFAEHTRLAGIFSGQLKEIRLKAYPSDGLLEIVTRDSEIGEHSSRVKAQITGDGIEMSFNQRYLTEGLDPIASDSVLLRFSGPGRPLVIQDPRDVSYLYLAMPMKSV